MVRPGGRSLRERVPNGRSRPSSEDTGEPEFFRRMIAASTDRFAYLDRDLRYRAANASYLSSWDLTSEQVIGRRVDEIMDPDFYAQEVGPRLAACLAGETVVFEAQLPRRGVRTGWGEVTYIPWLDAAGSVVGVVVRVHDITARKSSHATIERLTRLYRILTECNQAIIHSEEPSTLFPVVCRELVTQGGLDMAWIGRTGSGEARIECLAVDGEGGAELVEGLSSSPEPDGLDDDPLARVMRGAEGYWSLDLQADPVTRPWHASARRFGWHASASLPLTMRGKVFAVLSVYARDRDVFDDDARDLLAELARDISYALEHYAAIAELADAEERWKFALEGSDAGVWDWDLRTGKVFYSAHWKSLLGLGEEDICERLDAWKDRVHPDDSRALSDAIDDHLRGRTTTLHHEHRLRRRDGLYVWSLGRGKVVERAPDGTPLRMIGTTTDISARHAANDSLSRLGEIVEKSQTEVYVFDPDRLCFEQVNQGARVNLGYDIVELIGMTPLDLMPDYDPPTFSRLLEPLREGSKSQVVLETRHRRKDGSCYPAEIRLQLLGVEPRFVALVTDTTERRRAEEAIKHLAFFDPLTGLPNRRLLMDRLERAIAASRRSHRMGALIFIDLDDFKSLNDTLGHDQGDRLLRQVAKRLASCIRESDTLARLGGDEFVVMLERLSAQTREAASQAEVLANKLLEALRAPCELENREYRCSASMGIALFGRQAKSVEELMKQADMAMYRAKAAGRDTMRFFDPQMQVEVSARVALAASLRQGLEHGEFLLHYQSQVDGAGQVTGAEGLLRWQHPQRGLLQPVDFIRLAEETATILPLGRWVLEMACAQLAVWSERPETAGLTLAINISALQFHHPDFVKQVLAAIERHGCNPERLKLEITENLLLDDRDAMIAKMSMLKEQGISFALDDFGTGYSSLTDLGRLPLKELKIDLSFVRDLVSNANDAAIARTIIALGDTFALDVIAEGVETEAQRDWLVGHGCRAFQGYLFGRPGPAATSAARLDA
ncbi:EAL domain-containing protein [Thiocapsa sp.]|uniref:EAL domain-containing protein n=1 Tax=Thiocapsa sp. TaxID=2024551 RepID=UPI0025D0A82A|nr:EAL domain-containing protein [Thiocapsa sp.]